MVVSTAYRRVVQLVTQGEAALLLGAGLFVAEEQCFRPPARHTVLQGHAARRMHGAAW
jgi:hypothetical protein